jgi:hypothetical protein
MRRAFAHDLREGGKQRMLAIRAVEPVISIAPAYDQTCGLELRQLILDGSEREKTQSRQLPCVKLLTAISEQQSQHLGPNRREQTME